MDQSGLGVQKVVDKTPKQLASNPNFADEDLLANDLCFMLVISFEDICLQEIEKGLDCNVIL